MDILTGAGIAVLIFGVAIAIACCRVSSDGKDAPGSSGSKESASPARLAGGDPDEP